MQRKLIWSILLSSVLAALCSVAVSAREQVHVVKLMPGSETFHLPLAGWLVDEEVAYSFKLISPPQMGEWLGETYVPRVDFWRAGGDVFSLSLSDSAGFDNASHILVLIASRPEMYHRLAEDFEATDGSISGIDPIWELAGDSDQIWVTGDALSGQWSLGTRITTSGSESGLGRTVETIQGEPGGVDQVRVEAEINTDPPGSPRSPGGDQMSGDEIPGIVSLMTIGAPLGDAPQGNAPPMAEILMRLADGGLSLSVELNPAFVDCTVCKTPWRPISWSEVARYSLRIGRTAQGHPAHDHPSLSFTVTPAVDDLLPETIDRLEDLALDMRALRRFGFGTFEADPSLTGVELRLDDLEATIRRIEFSDQRSFQIEGFEDGAIGSDWWIDGPVALGSPAGAGSWQAEVDLRVLSTSNSERATLTDTSPRKKGSLTSSFLLDLERLNLAEGERLVVFSASSMDGDPRAGQILWVSLRRFQSRLQIRATTEDDESVAHSTSWIDLDKSPVPVTVRWQATTNRASGSVKLWALDQQAEISVANDSQSIESVSFGVQNLVSPPFSGSVDLKILGIDNLATFD